MPIPNILVVGDVMLDVYIDGTVKRRSPETGVPIVATKSIGNYQAGGVGNVGSNVNALGGFVRIVTVMGSDYAADRMPTNAMTWLVVNHDERLTTQKIRIVGDGEPTIRLDIESEEPIDDETAELVIKSVHGSGRPWYDANSEPIGDDILACVISDYGKGVVTEKVARETIEYFRSRHIPVLVDPIGKCWKKYDGAAVIKANLKEAALAAGLEERLSQVHQIGHKLVEEYATNIAVTCGEYGLYLYEEDGAYHHFPNRVKVEKADVVGAGDTVIAAMAVRMALGDGLSSACSYAVAAANLVVQKPGTATVTAQEIDEFLNQSTSR